MPPKKDLTGQRFGKLVVIELAKNTAKTTWRCKCDCGNETNVVVGSLTSGNTKSCGCGQRRNVLGMRFGKLTVLSESGINKQGEILWLCQCDCGNEKIVTANHLYNTTKSCGCIKSEMMIQNNKNKVNLIEGFSYDESLDLTAAYKSYRTNAKRRKINFDLTLEDFLEFVLKECHYCGVGKLNKKGKTPYNGIDRKENGVGYIKSNCLPCCFICNRAKSTMSYNDFISWIENLIRFHKEINHD